jgi:MoxR-like ATPase
MVQSARALALLRGRRHVLATDIRDLAPDVLRHRLVLSYDALGDGITSEQILESVLAAVPLPGSQSAASHEPPPPPPAPPQYRPPGPESAAA